MTSDQRLASLARRLRWLERSRRPIAIVIAAIGTIVGVVFVPDLLGPDWPRFHARITAVTAALVLALVIDIGLAALTAMWEVQHDRLARAVDERIPRAIVRRK